MPRETVMTVMTALLRHLIMIGGVAMALTAGPGCSNPRDAQSAELPATSRKTENPPELGKVTWRRDYDAALAEARKSGKPVLLLFDEVPGCSTVNAFGRDVLSDRTVVRAADSLFISVVVYNNEDRDKLLLDRWKEPAWNNPIIRFIDGSEKPLGPRLTHRGGVAGVLATMVAALEAARQPVPDWLRTAAR